MTDQYDEEAAVSPEIENFAGPYGIGLVAAFDDGRTQPGWGVRKPADPANSGFMHHYTKGAFRKSRLERGYAENKWHVALVMRSVSLLCVDIDGKNNGFINAPLLGDMPLTLAETSKSGNGYHLFYTVQDVWDNELGFARFADRIGVTQGVDIRATGCVYHHKSQRWNGRKIAPLPVHLAQRLTTTEQKNSARKDMIAKVLATSDDHEVLMLQDDLVQQLNAPIPAGRRNNTLFAIGSQMKLAEVKNWEQLVTERAAAVGLATDEARKLVNNIRTYA